MRHYVIAYPLGDNEAEVGDGKWLRPAVRANGSLVCHRLEMKL